MNFQKIFKLKWETSKNVILVTNLLGLCPLLPKGHYHRCMVFVVAQIFKTPSRYSNSSSGYTPHLPKGSKTKWNCSCFPVSLALRRQVRDLSSTSQMHFFLWTVLPKDGMSQGSSFLLVPDWGRPTAGWSQPPPAPDMGSGSRDRQICSVALGVVLETQLESIFSVLPMSIINLIILKPDGENFRFFFFFFNFTKESVISDDTGAKFEETVASQYEEKGSSWGKFSFREWKC